MPSLVLRRALAQWRPLVAVVVLVTAATTLLGVGAQLLAPTQDRAFGAALVRLDPEDVDVTAYVVDLAGADLASSRADAADLVAEVLGPLDPTLTSAASSRMRRLVGTDGLGYLATTDSLESRAELVSGRWPDAASGSTEAAVPATAADRLGAGPGDQVTLGAETGLGGADDPVEVTVVGTYRVVDASAWSGDPLDGAGFDPAYEDGSASGPAYGPFVVTDDAFLASGSAVTGLRVTGHPTLQGVDEASVREAAAALDDGSARLSAVIGDRAQITRLGSELPRTVDRLRTQSDSTRSTVAAVLLLGTGLALAALLLAGRLLADVREDERRLLVALGLSPGQQLRLALAESFLVALLAAALAVPAAALVHARLTRRPDLAAAGLEQGPEIGAVLVLTVAVGALVLAGALVGPALDRRPLLRDGARRAAVGWALDALLVLVAALAAWQLRSSPGAAASTGDVTLALAPVVGLAAATTVVVRRVPPLLGLLARSGRRSRSLVLPLAVRQSARRPHAALALVLLANAFAAATFATSVHATWERSQRDQADLRIGTDLALALSGPATTQDADAVGAAAEDGVLSPVVQTGVALGRYVGEPGDPPALLAVDTRESGRLLRGRTGPGGWGAVGADLAPAGPLDGIAVTRTTAVEIEGRAPARMELTVTPQAVVEDAIGLRRSVPAAALPLDGTTHRVRWRGPLGEGRLVAVRLEVSGAPSDDAGLASSAPLSLAVRVAGATAAGDWQVTSLGRDTPVRAAAVELDQDAAGAVLRTETDLDLTYLAYTGATLLATSFDPPAGVPAAVSEELVRATGVEVGGTLAATVAGVPVTLRVTAVVPDVPSLPGRAAALVDVDLLSRVLLGLGQLDPVVDAWWVGAPSADTEAAVRAAALGSVTTRTEVTDGLARGPLRVTTPLALLVLVGAAAALLLAGTGLLVAADQRRRAAEVARLRALGLTRRETRRLLLTEHALLLVPLLLVGAAVGGVAAWALGPSLVRSDTGAAPLPETLLVWPWTSELLLLGGLLAGAAVVTAGLVTRQVRRSDPALLRSDTA